MAKTATSPIPPIPKTAENIAACNVEILPPGSGRRLVRDIAASTWDSTRQLNAAAEEAMRAIPTSARKTAPGLATETGMASAAPTAAVSITKATTRGLPSDQKSRMRGNSAAARAGVFTDSGV